MDHSRLEWCALNHGFGMARPFLRDGVGITLPNYRIDIDIDIDNNRVASLASNGPLSYEIDGCAFAHGSHGRARGRASEGFDFERLREAAGCDARPRAAAADRRTADA